MIELDLSEPLDAPDGPITRVELVRPSVGQLRGLQLSMVQMQDVSAMMKLLPRITRPALTPDQVAALAPADFAAMCNQVSLFFMSPEQAEAVRLMQTSGFQTM